MIKDNTIVNISRRTIYQFMIYGIEHVLPPVNHKDGSEVLMFSKDFGVVSFCVLRNNHYRKS